MWPALRPDIGAQGRAFSVFTLFYFNLSHHLCYYKYMAKEIEEKKLKKKERKIDAVLKKIPATPGVYIMKGAHSTVLYIGKAKNLRSRVRSYFSTAKSSDTRYAAIFLASRVKDIDYIVTANEKEALLLEDTLLKKHKPRYNIRLKDSKTYVRIKITTGEEFPRILVTRSVAADGSRYFGPYISAKAVRDTIKFLRRIFPLRTCSNSFFKNRTRPCLDFQLGICSAPATGHISALEYRALVNSAMLFLEGKNNELVKALKAKMDSEASAQKYEEAALTRDQIEAIKAMLETQRVVSDSSVEQDIFAVARSTKEGDGPKDDSTGRSTDRLSIEALGIRSGRLVSAEAHIFEDIGFSDAELLGSFVTEYYRGGRYVPKEILLPCTVAERSVLIDWLSEKAKRKISITVPQKGKKIKLIEMAKENAAEALKKRAEDESKETEVITALKSRLRLTNRPVRIEAFDISNLGASNCVGAMVSFVDGKAQKKSYRLFKIKDVKGPDDYAMMREVLSRRYASTSTEVPKDKKSTRNKNGASPSLPMPSLILMDGGKGQLNVAIKVLDELGITGIDIAALAKDKTSKDGYRESRSAKSSSGPKGERVFRPGVKDPVLLKEGSKPDLLLRRIRDEVHRFAITYQRKLRGKAAVRSILDSVPGVGKERKRALFAAFGDIKGISGATVEELCTVKGVTEKIAKRLKEETKVETKKKN
ncbi:MAG: excinuclease ABC subunit UvrC [Proteobacteria bacterium]|nr:excinuclease ABC subunit UvrC [Pseudomonadota bacterium]